MEPVNKTAQPTWQEGVVIGITEALAALKRGDPQAVQVWLGNAMAAARLEERRNAAT